MDDGNRWVMETEEEEEEEFEFEEGEDIMVFEEAEQKEEESEEEEEVEELEEMRAPLVASWTGPDGNTVHGIICIDDGVSRLKNRCRSDECSICYVPCTTHGKHQFCCLPCGHMYGFSCIKKWLRPSSSSRKCPQCNVLCSSKDVILLYPPRLCNTAAREKASSAAFFPFTKQGFLEFEQYEYSRMLDADSLCDDDITHMDILATKHHVLTHQGKRLARERDEYLAWADKLEERAQSLGFVDALRRRANMLNTQVEALGRRTDALDRLISALTRRIDALDQRYDAYESRIRICYQVYEEHLEREKQTAKANKALEMKKKLAEKPNKKGEKEADKAAEKNLNDKDVSEEETVEDGVAEDTVDVPEEEMVVDGVAEEPEEEKVEVKVEPKTKTTEASDNVDGPEEEVLLRFLILGL